MDWDILPNCNCPNCVEARKETAEQAAPEVKEVPTSRTLTREMVMRGRPCYDYRSQFIKRFSDSVEVTLELALSQKDDWDWDWAASYLLSRKALAKFYQTTKKLDDKFDSDMKPYGDLLNKAYDEYYRVRDEASAEARDKGLSDGERWAYINKKTDEARLVHNAAYNAAWKVATDRKEEAVVRTWVELFLADEADYTEQHKNDDPYVERYDENGEEIWEPYEYDENEDY